MVRHRKRRGDGGACIRNEPRPERRQSVRTKRPYPRHVPRHVYIPVACVYRPRISPVSERKQSVCVKHSVYDERGRGGQSVRDMEWSAHRRRRGANEPRERGQPVYGKGGGGRECSSHREHIVYKRRSLDGEKHARGCCADADTSTGQSKKRTAINRD